MVLYVLGCAPVVECLLRLEVFLSFFTVFGFVSFCSTSTRDTSSPLITVIWDWENSYCLPLSMAFSNVKSCPRLSSLS